LFIENLYVERGARGGLSAMEAANGGGNHD
jgi:hypothetical protein